ncbi:MAG: hypothetical protein HPY52_14890 [Firmicutes bacterium]|nr:hypothetical protein [Bacillota bacterium]
MELKHVIQTALSMCKVDHDGLESMSQVIEEWILANYILTPKEEPDLSRKLDRLQSSILKGEEPEQELAAAINEVDEGRYFEHLTFEDAEAWERLRRKASYLQELLHKLKHRRTIRRLQDELQKLISPEAWEVYLRIEEEVNAEIWRLQQEGATR